MSNFENTPAVTRMTPYGGDYFFGYYDLTPQNGRGDKYLYHKTDFIDRIQKKGDKAVLGWFDPGRPSNNHDDFHPLAETRAWNFQQGAMLQWHPRFPDDTLIYNHESSDGYRGTVHNIETGEKRYLDQPVANVSPCGRKAVSINFARMFTFRPGYGYAGLEDPWFDVNQPGGDGIYRVDLETGEAPLILSLKEIWERAAARAIPDEKGPKILMNHITWNTDGTRFLFLLRYISASGKGWKTSVMVSDESGQELDVLIPFGYASHYWWITPDEVMFYSMGGDQGSEHGFYVINIKDKTYSLLNSDVFKQDVHMSLYPGSSWVLNDTYPTRDSSPVIPSRFTGQEEGYRQLFLYNRETAAVKNIGRFFSPAGLTGDFRCDLHPRWSRDGSYVTFDSLHEGFRGIYRVDWAD